MVSVESLTNGGENTNTNTTNNTTNDTARNSVQSDAGSLGSDTMVMTMAMNDEKKQQQLPSASSQEFTTLDMGNTLMDDDVAEYRKPTMGAPSIARGQGMTVTMQDVTYTVRVNDEEHSSFFRKKKMDKVLLDNISCSFVPGRLCALMGSSGAGKSTLMDLVAGRKNQGRVDGNLLFDGKSRPDFFKRVAGYVEQQDVLIPTLTVRETLMYAAELRLPKSQYSREEKDQRVEEIIQELGLSHCADSLVGDNMTRGVSGGERKRVSIGVELVTSPRILFLDEPTSGLDSATTLDVVRVLRKLSRSGRTIICTIHQPSASAFALFDQLVLLSKGRVCYNGPVLKAETYFRSLGFDSTETIGFNPADFILAVAGGGTGKSEKTITGNFSLNLAEQWDKTTMSEKRMASAVARAQSIGDSAITAKDLPPPNSQWHELVTLMSRSWRCNIRDRNYIVIHLLKNIIIAIILVSIFYNVNSTDTYPNINALALLFMVVTMWSMGGIAYIAPLIQEREVYYRERQSAAYRVLPYYFQRCIIELPFSLITVTVFSLIVYWGCGYPADAGKFFVFWLVVFLCNECAQAFAQTVSAVSPTVEVATAVTPMILIVFMLFSGFMLTTSDIPVYWRYTVRYLSFVAYAFQALGNNTFSGTANEAVIAMYELDEYSTWTNIGCLIAMIAMWRILGILAIKFIIYQKR